MVASHLVRQLARYAAGGHDTAWYRDRIHTLEARRYADGKEGIRKGPLALHWNIFVGYYTPTSNCMEVEFSVSLPVARLYILTDTKTL